MMCDSPPNPVAHAISEIISASWPLVIHSVTQLIKCQCKISFQFKIFCKNNNLRQVCSPRGYYWTFCVTMMLSLQPKLSGNPGYNRGQSIKSMMVDYYERVNAQAAGFIKSIVHLIKSPLSSAQCKSTLLPLWLYRK